MARPIQALLKLTADPSQAKRALGEVSTDLKQLDRLSPEARVRIRDEGANAQLDRLRKRLAALDAQEVTPNIQIAKANTLRQIDRVEGRLKGVGDSNRDLVRSNARLRTSFGNIWAHGGAAFAAVGGAYALKTALESVVNAYGESQKVGAQTNAVLRSTHGAAKVSREEVTKLATAISKKTGFDDEAVQSSENLLLTFTRVRNEAGKGNKVFTDTTGVIGDMSRALGQDFKSSTIQVGKALNDPIKGLTALRRVGVAFTDSQEKTIKKLVESGHTLDAQKIILRELRKEFGGSADAYGKTMPGAIDKAKTAFENLEETIGAKLAPTVTDIATKAAKFIDQLQDGTGAGGEFRDKLAQIGREIGNVLGPIGRFAARVVKFADEHPKVRKVALGIVGVGVALRGLRFAAALTGVDKLLGGLRRLAKTRAGERAAEAIASGLSSGLSAASGRLKGLFRRLFHRFGSAGGSAAADFAAGSLYANMGPQLDRRRGKLRKVFAAFGRRLGGALGVAAGVTAALLIQEKLNEALGQAGKKSREDPSNPFSRTPGYTDPGESLADKIRGLLGFSKGGVVPGTGDRDTVPAMLTPGEIVLPLPIVRAIGLGRSGSAAAVGGGGMQQTNHWHVTAPSPDYVASRWEHRTADAMRRRGVAFTRS